MPATPARRKGGQVSTRVMVLLNPRVLTTLSAVSSGLLVRRSRTLFKDWTRRLNSRWEERIERARAQMEVLHQAEQPCSLVLAGLPQTLHHANLLARIANAVALHTVVSHLALLWGQPRGSQGSVGKQAEAEDGYKCCYRALTGTVSKDRRSLQTNDIHDKEPPPARNTVHTVQAGEYSRSNQSRESRRQNLCAVQQSNTRRNLCVSSVRCPTVKSQRSHSPFLV